MLKQILNKLFNMKEIGLDEDRGTVYLRRWHLWMLCRPHVYVHHFLHSDHDRSMHDHPWAFLSIILKGGYWEHTPVYVDYVGGHIVSGKKWYRPGSILWRRAKHIHRVELWPGKTAWTLVFTFKRERDWGFWPRAGQWCWWKNYNAALGICEEGRGNQDDGFNKEERGDQEGTHSRSAY